MSYAIHTYFLDEKKYDEESVFDSVQNLFINTNRIQFAITKNIFTKKDFLKLTIDNSYSISVFFDNDANISDDLEFITGQKLNCKYRLRFLFAPDPENNFDDIAVIILTYLESLYKVILYSVNENRIIFNSLKK